jgi:2'-5' RNA ligase
MPRQAALFLSGDAARAVQNLRRAWDSLQADRIDPHITLVYELDDSANVRHELEEVAGATPRFQIWLGKAIRWGPPEDGIAIEVIDRDGGLGRLLADLRGRGFRTTGRPHVTLVHGRTVETPDLNRAWESLKEQELGLRHTVEWLAVVEQRAERWVRMYDCSLGGDAT